MFTSLILHAINGRRKINVVYDGEHITLWPRVLYGTKGLVAFCETREKCKIFNTDLFTEVEELYENF